MLENKPHKDNNIVTNIVTYQLNKVVANNECIFQNLQRIRDKLTKLKINFLIEDENEYETFFNRINIYLSNMVTEIKANYINIFINYQKKERKYKEIILNLNEEVDFLKNQLDLARKDLKSKETVIEEGKKIILNKSKNEEDLLKLLVENIVLRVENDSLVSSKMLNNLEEEKNRPQTTPNNNIKYRNFIKNKGCSVKRNRNINSFLRDKIDFINSTNSFNNICETCVGNRHTESPSKTCICKKELQKQKMKSFSNFENCYQNINVHKQNLKHISKLKNEYSYMNNKQKFGFRGKSEDLLKKLNETSKSQFKIKNSSYLLKKPHSNQRTVNMKPNKSPFDKVHLNNPSSFLLLNKNLNLHVPLNESKSLKNKLQIKNC